MDGRPPVIAAAKIERHRQPVRIWIDRKCLCDLGGSRIGNLADQLILVPMRFPLDTGRVVLDLAAIGRETRRTPLAGCDDHHRLSLRDGHPIGRLEDLLHSLAHPPHVVWIATGSAAPVSAAAEPASSAAATAKSAAPSPAAPAAAAGTVAALRRRALAVTEIFVERPGPHD